LYYDPPRRPEGQHQPAAGEIVERTKAKLLSEATKESGLRQSKEVGNYFFTNVKMGGIG
jgi:hypothetical protein